MLWKLTIEGLDITIHEEEEKILNSKDFYINIKIEDNDSDHPKIFISSDVDSLDLNLGSKVIEIGILSIWTMKEFLAYWKWWMIIQSIW